MIDFGLKKVDLVRSRSRGAQSGRQEEFRQQSAVGSGGMNRCLYITDGLWGRERLLQMHLVDRDGSCWMPSISRIASTIPRTSLKDVEFAILSVHLHSCLF